MKNRVDPKTINRTAIDVKKMLCVESPVGGSGIFVGITAIASVGLGFWVNSVGMGVGTAVSTGVTCAIGLGVGDTLTTGVVGVGRAVVGVAEGVADWATWLPSAKILKV